MLTIRRLLPLTRHFNTRAMSTPASCIADFCLIPMGTVSVSVSNHVAQIQRILAEQPGIVYTLGPNGTSVEGSWKDVTTALGVVHQRLHENGIVRIHTDIRIGSRTDKAQSAADKKRVVEEILAEKA